MSEPPETPAPAQRNSSGILLWLVVIGLVVYPLSTGPVLRLWEARHWPFQPLLVFYGPLIWVGQQSVPVEAFFGWYIRSLWGCKHSY